MTDGPIRTCIGCRQRRPQRELVRLVRRADGVVTVDRRGAAPGRGAYLCTEASCLTSALKSGRWSRVFRKPCEAGPILAEEVRGQWRQKPR